MSDGFTQQFAVRMPNGELLSYQPACTYSAHLFGSGHPERRVRVFEDRADAEAEIELRRRYAATELGIEWTASIEQRNCSSFSVTDPSVGLGDEIEKWAETQGGAE